MDKSYLCCDLTDLYSDDGLCLALRLLMTRNFGIPLCPPQMFGALSKPSGHSVRCTTEHAQLNKDPLPLRHLGVQIVKHSLSDSQLSEP